jgi:hypothetical protein
VKQEKICWCTPLGYGDESGCHVLDFGQPACVTNQALEGLSAFFPSDGLDPDFRCIFHSGKGYGNEGSPDMFVWQAIGGAVYCHK